MRTSDSEFSDQTWVFCAEEVDVFAEFLYNLPADITQLQIDEWMGRGWRYVFGDDREHVMGGLHRLTAGAPFRVRLAA
jgi:hypothetical protein